MTRLSVGARFVFSAFCLLAASVANADTVTWVGAASGGAWSASANWQDGSSVARVPGTDDVASFPSSTTDVTLDAATAVKGVKVVGAFTLNGTAKLTLGASGVDAAGAGADVTVNVPLELSSGDVSFLTSTASADNDLFLEGVVSGAGRLDQKGKGRLHLKCANTFTGGLWCHNLGSNTDCVRVYEGTSLGGPDGSGAYGTVTLDHQGDTASGLCIMKNMTVANPFSLTFYGSIWFGPNVKTATSSVNNGEVVFSGDFSAYGNFSFNAQAANALRVRFLKPVVQTYASYCAASMGMQNVDASTLHFEGGLRLGAQCQFAAGQRGRICLYDAPGGNSWRYASFQSGGILCYGTNVLPMTDGSYVEIENWDAELDLRGMNQRIPRFRSKGNSENTIHYLRSSTGDTAVLEVTGGDNDMFGGVVKEKVTFCWNPASAKTMTFKTQTSTTTGDLVVSNGTIRLSNSAKFTKIGAVRVSDGAKFTIDLGTSINDKAAVYVYGTGKISLPSGQGATVSDVFVNGTAVDRGVTYVSEEATTVSGERVSWLEGEGTLAVSYGEIVQTSATWNGGAGASETSVGEAANWEGGALPALTSGGLTATFASAGAEATVDRNVALYGLVLDAPEDGFTLADGGGRLKLRASGLTAAAATQAKTYTVDVPVTLDGVQTWTVNTNASKSVNVVFTKPISSLSSTTLTKAGKGKLTLKGVNTFTGDFAIDVGDVHLRDDGTLGKGGVGKVTLKWPDAKLYLHNATVDRVLETSGASGAPHAGSIEAVANTTNVLKRLVKRESNNLRLYSRSGARLVIAGGLKGNWFHPDGGGEFVITNTPLDCSYFGPYGGSAIMRFQVAGNSCAQFGQDSGCNATVHFDVDNVFAKRSNVYPDLTPGTGGLAAFYLHGTKQHFRNFGVSYDGCKPTLDSTDKPGAELYVEPATAKTYNWAVKGHVSIFKSGTATLKVNKSGESTGTLSVSQGLFELDSGIGWPNATNVVASSSGTFKFAKADAFSRNCDFTIDGANARLNLAFTGTAVCGRLFMRDAQNRLRPVPAGVYGASDNADAPIKLANITGTGLLRVRKPAGIAVYFK